ncbi:MAG: DUF2513 domain-containing protein [Burkholderiales bacterium]|nr:DUF2513 domain-containing protein [Burkholderiales bacterium]
MQRNWDVIRKILLKVEALPTIDSAVDSDSIEGVAAEVAAYHMVLMEEAGLIEGGGRPPGAVGGAAYRFATRLTWAGHELIDQIRRDTIWNRVKTLARDKGLELSVDVVRTLVKSVIEELLR